MLFIQMGCNKYQVLMFGNAYQNGHYFEVWDSKINQKNEQYKHLAKIHPNQSYFDKQVKTYIHSLQTSNSKIQLPAQSQKELALHQKYLILHIFLPQACPWTMELVITDLHGIKRRINFTTVPGKSEVKFFSVRYPLDSLERGTWLFLAFNVHSFIDIFKGQVFRSLDQITIGSVCKIRRIFTMKEWQQWEIPKSFWLNNEIPQQFQLIEYRELCLPKIGASKNLSTEQQSPPQIDKQGSIKSSKNNLSRSEIMQKHLQNQHVSPVKVIMSKIESLQREKDKIQVASKQTVMKESKIRHKTKMVEAKRNSKHQKTEKNQQQEKHEKHQKKQKQQTELIRSGESKAFHDKIKISPKKSPHKQKSFQEDEALNYKPDMDEDENFETSNESFINKSLKNNKSYQKWQETDLPKSQSKITEAPQLPSSGAKKQSGTKQTILTKQNQTNKIMEEQHNELELIYDEMVGCYYHPETHTYYEIKHA